MRMKNVMIAGLAMLLAGGGFASAALKAPERLPFELVRGGSQIGSHTLEFTRNGDELIVDVAIEMKVKVLFITAFRYAHTAREIWRDDRLVSLVSQTYDNGEAYAVEAVAKPDGIHVTGAGEPYVVPLDTMPSSYWNYRTTRADSLINSQKGVLEAIKMDYLGREMRELDGRSVEVEHWRLQGSLAVDIWYHAETRQWLDMSFEARGEAIDYVLTEPSAVLPPVREAYAEPVADQPDEQSGRLATP